MLDIKAIRNDPEGIEERLRRRDSGIDLSDLVGADQRRRETLQAVEVLKARKNEVSREVGARRKAGENADDLIGSMRAVGEELSGLEATLAEITQEVDSICASLPNLPHADVVPGSDLEAAECIRQEGTCPERPEDSPHHLEIAERLGLLDMERGARLAGSQFAFHRGWGARLEWALIQMMLDVQVGEKGYEMILPPLLANTETLTASGQLPKFADQVYRCADDDLYAIPTAEVPLTGMHRGDTLREDDLPLRYCAYTPCFRREAGAHGAQERGLIRVHQFNKVEIYRYTRPETSYEHLEEIVSDAEDILRRLGLHFRTIRLVAGDLAQQAAMTYDIEVWIPGQGRYYEVSSVSNCEDYLARRASIRHRPTEGGKPRFVHTLNGSALATSRLFAAILETFETSDGSVEIPEVLRSYLGGVTRLLPDGGAE